MSAWRHEDIEPDLTIVTNNTNVNCSDVLRTSGLKLGREQIVWHENLTSVM